MKLRVVFAGTPAFAVPPLAALHEAHQLVGVLTQPDRPAGRGRGLTASPVKEAALARGVPVAQPARLRGDPVTLEATLALLREWRPDVIVVVAYGLILPRAVLELPRLGCLNIHASLLPRWRGAAPIQRAIEAGDAETGVAIMQMDEGLDTGGVLATARVAIGPETTAARLHDELAQLGAAQLLVALDGLARGTLHAQPQPGEGVTYAEKLSRAESRIDWRLDARAIDRKVRAFNAWPVAEAVLAGEPVKLLRSRAGTAGESGAAPGTLLGLASGGEALEVACGQGVLQVLELQRAGRKPVSARDFFNALRPVASAPQVFA
jgi:methionyl-tRNA formyltransferase